MRSAAPAPTALPGPLHRELRAATRSDHVAVDGMVRRLDLSLRAHYGVLLRVHHEVLQQLEADWREEDRSDFSALLHCARDDLQALKLLPATVHAVSRSLLSAGQRLGVAYVVRTSRLDTGALRHRVRAPFPTAYLDYAVALTWPRFLLQLDPPKMEGGRSSSYEATRGARLAFGLYAGLLTQTRIQP